MNARTVEVDRIPPEAGIRTLLAGARMNAQGKTARLGYPVDPANLINAMANSGVLTRTMDAQSKSVTEAPPGAAAPPRGQLVIEVLPPNWSAADAEIARWQGLVKSEPGAVMVASPNPSPSENERNDQLTVAALWGPGIGAGLLRSPSTRRAGLIANTDVAPTLAKLAGISLEGPTYGAACDIVPTPYEHVAKMLTAIEQQSQNQAIEQLWAPYLAIGLAFLVVAASCLSARRSRYAPAFVIASVLSPLVLVTAPTHTIAIDLIAALFVLSAIVCRLSPRSFGAHLPVVGASLVTAAIIMADALLNQGLLTADSLLGFTPMEGARYYGLGNEAMGILIGATVILTGAVVVYRGGAWMGAAFWLIVATVLGSPSIGAKAGGLIASLIVLVVYGACCLPWRSRTRAALAVACAAAIAACAGILILVVLGHSSDSHVSRTVGQAHRYGFGIIGSVVLRKASMDLHLMVHSAWMLVLLACAFGTAAALRWNSLARPQPARVILWTGCAATIVCLVLNDAGVVGAALCAVFLWAYQTTTPPPAPAQAGVEEGVDSLAGAMRLPA